MNGFVAERLEYGEPYCEYELLIDVLEYGEP